MSHLFRATGAVPLLPGSTSHTRTYLNDNAILQQDTQPPAKAPPAPCVGVLFTFLVRPAALFSVLLTEYKNRRSHHFASRRTVPAPKAPAESGHAAGRGTPCVPAEGRDVFISYSSRDREVADTLCATLEANQIRCWIAPRDLVAGSDWSESIITAIVQCRVMVLVLSAGSNHSAHVKREVERAAFHRKILIPIRTEKMLPSPSLEYFISLNHWFDASTPPLAPHFTRLAVTIRGLCDTPTPANLSEPVESDPKHC